MRWGRMWASLRRLLKDCRAANAMEYALMLGMIVLAAIGAFQALGDSVDQSYDMVSSHLQAATSQM